MRNSTAVTETPWLGPALILATLLATPLSAQCPFPADADLQVMLDYLVEGGATPGIVFGIVEADRPVRVLSAGPGGPDSPPLGPQSVLELGLILAFRGTELPGWRVAP